MIFSSYFNLKFSSTKHGKITRMPRTASQPIRAILWDMDGVLVDTGEIHFLAWKQTLAGFDIPFSKPEFLETFGMNNTSVLNTIFKRTLSPNSSPR